MIPNEYVRLFDNAFFGITLTLLAFYIGLMINRKTKLVICNPLFIAIAIVIVFLLITGIKYETYEIGGSMIQFLLTPATVAFAVPLYRQLNLLKKNITAIFVGILSGCVACLFTIFILSKIFGFSREILFGILPKSVTLAIALGITEELGGLSGVTCVGVVLSGIMGAAFMPLFSRLFKIKDKVALGLAVGTASHAIGTSRAMETDEIVGAMGSLSIVVAGVLTVILVPIVSILY